MFEIDPDVRRAELPPAWFYESDEAFELVRARVLARSWHWIGDEGALAAKGSCQPATLAPGALDEPVVLVRDSGDELRAFSNICTHRGAILCETAGTKSDLRCRYHGRRFALDGRMLAAPGFEGAENFPSAADHLKPVPLARWRGLLFAALEPARDFSTLWTGLGERFAALPLERAAHVVALDRDYEIDANWALYLDNYLEGFHIPFVHPGLSAAVDVATYGNELFPWATLQVARARKGELALELGSAERIAAYYLWLYPTTMLNFYPWGVSLNVVQPLATRRTRILFRHYVWDESKRANSAGADLHGVEMEDEEVVASVQRALASRLRGRGRYSPKHEIGVHHFHRLLAAELSNA